MRLALGAVATALLVTACPGGDDPPGPRPSGSPVSVAPPSGLQLLDLFVDAPTAPSGPRGGTVRVAVPGEATTLDPFSPGGDTPAARDLAPLWLPGLYRRLPDGKRAPWIAAGRPAPTADGRRVVIDLRPDATWSDGSPITSADVAATWRFATGRPGPWRSAYQVLAGVETPTPSRAVLVLKAPGVTWAPLFTAPTGVLPAARLDALAGKPYDLSVTGGPFTLTRRTPGLGTTWARTPHPWPGSDPLLDGLDLQVVPDFTTATELVRAGRVDVVAPYSSIDAARRLTEHDARPVVSGDASSITLLTLRTDRGPLKDLRVRQAIAAALDRGTFADRLLQGDGVPTDDLVPPGRAGHRAPFSRWRRDVPAAKSLLAAAGWRDRGGRPRTKGNDELTLVLTSTSPDDLVDAVVRGLQVQLREIGVQLDLAATPADQSAELARTGQADIAITRWDTDAVADLGRLLTSGATGPDGSGWSRWKDAPADALFAAAVAARDLEAYDVAVAKALSRVADQVPVLPLYAVHPVTGARDVTVQAPLGGYGGPFATVTGWSGG